MGDKVRPGRLSPAPAAPGGGAAASPAAADGDAGSGSAFPTGHIGVWDEQGAPPVACVA